VHVHTDMETLKADGTGAESEVEECCNGRVAPGSYPPGAPTDPDVRNSRIRLLRSAFRCTTVNTVNHARRR